MYDIIKQEKKKQRRRLFLAKREMEYGLIFLEGIASFVSPCLLPMVPIYIAYFAGEKEADLKKTIVNSLGFILGFTFVFLLLSVFASQLGSLVSQNMKYIKVIFGIVMILFGLNYMEIWKIKWLNQSHSFQFQWGKINFLKTFLFGILFSISWTPCIGSFLSSALLMIAKSQDLVKGMVMISLYAIGLGIPFLLSAVLMDKIKGIFQVVKKNYDKIQKVSGVLLIAMGIYTIFF